MMDAVVFPNRTLTDRPRPLKAVLRLIEEPFENQRLANLDNATARTRRARLFLSIFFSFFYADPDERI